MVEADAWDQEVIQYEKREKNIACIHDEAVWCCKQCLICLHFWNLALFTSEVLLIGSFMIEKHIDSFLKHSV